MKNEPTPRILADELKKLLYPPKPGETLNFAPLVTRFNKLCADSPRTVPDVARAQNEMANHLLVLAETKQDKSLVRAALQGLLDSGRLGRHAACWFVKSTVISLKQLAPMVANLPHRLRLHLLQELLRDPELEDKATVQWAWQQLEPLTSSPPEEIRTFLEEISLTGDTLSHPVRRIILAGTFQDWLLKRITSHSSSEFTSICRTIHALRSQEAIRKLATFVAKGGAIPDSEEIRLMTLAGDQADPTLAKAFQTLLTQDDEHAALAGAEGLARIAWPKTGQAFALVYRKYPNQRERLAVKAATLPHACLTAFLKTLSDKQRATVLAHIFAVAARLAPGFALDRIAQTPGMDPVTAKGLKNFVTAQKKKSLAGVKRRAMPPDPGAPVGLEKRGLVTRMFSEKQQTLPEILEMVHSPKDKNLPGSEFSGALTSRSLSRLGLEGSYLKNAQFIKVSFSAINFSHCHFSEVVFTGCTFSNCNFSNSIFRSTSFADCQFKNCEFTDAAFEDCSLEKGRIERCFLSGALFKATTITAIRFRYSSLTLCQFQICTFNSTQFKASALAHCQFISSPINGTEFFDCGFSHISFVFTDLTSTVLTRSSIEACSFVESSSDCGTFEQARMSDLLSKSSALEIKPVALPKIAAQTGSFLASCVDLWSRRLEIARFYAPLLLNNQRRLEHSARNMTGEDCFWLVPYLLHNDLIDQKLKIAGAPLCRIEGYTPSYTTLSLASRYLKGYTPTAPTASPLAILGLYAMGSVGSVAQTRASDVDYWVCYDATNATQADLAGLKAKLSAITKWAMETFELEIYFFLMSIADVQANKFGLSDKESSGSAQSILLKEEFYRTVVPVAGLHPAWWATPPGVSEPALYKWLAVIKTVPRVGASRFIDMGHLSPIPDEEFFGASLWQIVKALHSPYKSVMKLGLLEKYSSHKKTLMLADQIKLNLVCQQREVERVDPYVVLFRELRNYYRDINDKETVKLLTEALLLKANVGEFDFFFGFAGTFEQHSLLEFLFGVGKVNESRVRSLGQAWSFSKSMQIGTTVSRFMTATYKRIQGKLSQGGKTTHASITPEDMTRMGRQISANFARKKDKVVRVPFLRIKGYSELRFTADKSPGKKTIWVVHGRTLNKSNKSTTSLEPLNKSHSPATLLAWLVMNRLFAPKTLVDGDSSIAPLSAVDIKNALAKLHAFFPYDDIFELPPNDYLGPEQVTKAMLLVNLSQPPEVNQVACVDVIYATSWGEVFCLNVQSPNAKIKKNVQAWLADILPRTTKATQIKAIYPKRSQCPRLPNVK